MACRQARRSRPIERSFSGRLPGSRPFGGAQSVWCGSQDSVMHEQGPALSVRGFAWRYRTEGAAERMLVTAPVSHVPGSSAFASVKMHRCSPLWTAPRGCTSRLFFSDFLFRDPMARRHGGATTIQSALASWAGNQPVLATGKAGAARH